MTTTTRRRRTRMGSRKMSIWMTVISCKTATTEEARLVSESATRAAFCQVGVAAAAAAAAAVQKQCEIAVCNVQVQCVMCNCNYSVQCARCNCSVCNNESEEREPPEGARDCGSTGSNFFPTRRSRGGSQPLPFLHLTPLRSSLSLS